MGNRYNNDHLVRCVTKIVIWYLSLIHSIEHLTGAEERLGAAS